MAAPAPAPAPTSAPAPALTAAPAAKAPTKGAPMTESRKQMIKYAIIGIIVIGFGIILYMTMSDGDDDDKKKDSTDTKDTKDTDSKKQKDAVELCKNYNNSRSGCENSGCSYDLSKNVCVPLRGVLFKCKGNNDKSQDVDCPTGQYINPYITILNDANKDTRTKQCCIKYETQPHCSTNDEGTNISESEYSKLNTNTDGKRHIAASSLREDLKSNKAWDKVSDDVKHMHKCEQLLPSFKTDDKCVQIDNGIVYEYASQGCPYKAPAKGCEFSKDQIDLFTNDPGIIKSGDKPTVICKYGNNIKLSYTCGSNGKLTPDTNPNDKTCPQAS